MNTHSFEDVFRGRLLRIPDYQRGYAWEEKQWQDLIEDLALLPENRTHYTGTLVLHRQDTAPLRDQNGTTFQLFDVVDGQQRMTTLVILLQALSEKLAEDATLQRMAEGTIQTYVCTYDLNGQPIPKLQLNRDCHDFFFANVLQQAPDLQPARIASHERLAHARTFFTQWLAEQSAQHEDARAWLLTLHGKLTTSLQVLIHEVDSETDPGVVFETMNNRGRPITRLDKIKNYLLYLASKLVLPAENRLGAAINTTWSHIYETMMAANVTGTDNENQLLADHWLLHQDRTSKNWKGTQSVKDTFHLRRYAGRHVDLQRDILRYLETLRDATVAYCDIYAPDRDGAFGSYAGNPGRRDDIIRWSVKLRRLGTLATVRPLLMAARTRDKRDGQQYLEMVRLAELYIFRVYRWQGKRASAGQPWLRRLAHDFAQGRTFPSTLDSFQRALRRHCTNQELARRFEDENVNWYRWDGIVYMLFEYESHLAQQSGEGVRASWSYIADAKKNNSIEHILPQTIRDQPYWEARFDEESHARWVHDIGNLALTLYNASLSNRPFPEKRGVAGQPNCYASSKLFVEQALTRYEEWNKEALLERRSKIAAWAAERWHVPDAETAASDDHREAGSFAAFEHLLTRRSVSRGQKQLIRALYAAGESGHTNDELISVMGRRDRYDLTGVLGAFGRRIASTEGLKEPNRGIGWVLNIQKEDKRNWRYWLRPEFRTALEQLRPVWLQDLMDDNQENRSESDEQ